MTAITQILSFPNREIVMDEDKEDVDRMVAICAARGYSISKEEALAAWESYSEDYFASFIILGEDDEVFKALKDKCQVLPELT